MAATRNQLELLAPARNLECGIEAIKHGADAVYIGGPAFGARTAAANPVADIEKLAACAHRYSARVLVALNTILKDDELEPARRIAWQVYEAGADAPPHNGDGFSFYSAHGELLGMRINRVEAAGSSFRLYPAEAVSGLAPGMPLYHNHDQEFIRLLDKPSAERRIRVRMCLRETAQGFALDLLDESGVAASACLATGKQAAQQAEQSSAILSEHLGKFGATEFSAEAIDIDLSAAWFIPAAHLNTLRRTAVTALQTARREAWQRPPCRPEKSPAPQYPESALSYLGNVFNRQARSFYARHGVTLIQGKEKLLLRFDCRKCEMQVIGKLRKHRAAKLAGISA